MDLRELVEESHWMSVIKGWWGDAAMSASRPLAVDHLEVAAKLALVHSEVSEALECVRDGLYKPYENAERRGKPEGLPSELADVVIRVADLCGALGIDLDEAIRTKMAYNATRTHRHGGRNL